MVVVEDAATAAEAVRRFREERVGLVSRLGFGSRLGLGLGLERVESLLVRGRVRVRVRG